MLAMKRSIAESNIMSESNATCTKCGENKPLAEFFQRRDSHGRKIQKRFRTCRECMNADKKAWLLARRKPTVQAIRERGPADNSRIKPENDLTGKVFGNWTVLGPVFPHKVSHWHCRCI